jgi:hypothetical protein
MTRRLNLTPPVKAGLAGNCYALSPFPSLCQVFLLGPRNLVAGTFTIRVGTPCRITRSFLERNVKSLGSHYSKPLIFLDRDQHGLSFPKPSACGTLGVEFECSAALLFPSLCSQPSEGSVLSCYLALPLCFLSQNGWPEFHAECSSNVLSPFPSLLWFLT